MKLTKREKQILLNATELIATNKKQFSCHAITMFGLRYYFLADQYSKFYGFCTSNFWLAKYCDEDKYNWRQTLLLFFREAAGDME